LLCPIPRPGFKPTSSRSAVEVHRERDSVWLAPAGEVDIATVGKIEDCHETE
jgi:hypothetical protein